MRALIVDDEAPARRRLARLLGELSGVHVVGEVEDGEALMSSIAASAPDVLFLDIRMPGVDGLSLVEQHPELPPAIFVTAYDEYAVRAFEVNAIDYLVKPVRPERLAAAVERVRERLRSRAAAPEGRGVAGTARITSSSRGVLEVFEAARITRFWASQKYTLFLFDGTERLTEDSLSVLEARLLAQGFLRVHRAELIRVAAVRAVRGGAEGYEALLSDGQRARVSRRRVGALRAMLESPVGDD